MLRTARPLLGSAPRIALAGRPAPGRASAVAAALSSRLFLQGIVPPRRTAPLVHWTSFSSKPTLPNTRDVELEKEVAKQKLKVLPGEEVTAQSSVRPFLEQGQASATPDVDPLKSLQNDLHTVKDTFALGSVPREPYALGLAGTLPYLGTSIATVFLSWNLNTEWPHDSNLLNSILVSHETAAHWLHLLEPIQVGYGAVIISFLGAIHWGLEFAEQQTSRDRTRFRFGMGVIAPAVAWPTVFMPVEYALTTQFLTFVFLYFADSRATTRGWAPHWYATYRWVLTAVVGAAIFASLVGRAKVGEDRSRLRSGDLRALMGQKAAGSDEFHNWAKEEAEEKERIKKEKEAEEMKRKEEEKKRKAEEKKNKGGKDKPKNGAKDETDKNKKDADPKSEKQGDKDKGKETKKEKTE